MVSIPPGSSLGRYVLIEQIGRGGMATVFRAHDPNLDRHVAIKVLPSFHNEDPTFLDRFRQEAQTVARLSHPNILLIYDFGDDKGFTYIVTELVPGGTLEDKLGPEPMSTEDTLMYMGPLADALDHAHSQAIVHRDLKPANILLNQEGKPILADFGLARMLESSMRFTQASQAIGTPEYMSPEQAMGGDVDHRSDLYAFGVILYQMLVGQTPFRADTPAATLMAHVHLPLPLPTSMNPDINPRVESTLLKAMAKTPDDRFGSAKQMIQALSAAAGLAVQTIPQDDMEATAVLDTAMLDQQTLSDEAATAVFQSPTGEPEVAEEEAEPAVEPEEKPSRSSGRGLLLAAGAIAAAVIIAVVAFVLLQDGDDEAAPVVASATQPAEVAVLVPTAEPTAPPAEVAVVVPPPEPTATPAPVGACRDVATPPVTEAGIGVAEALRTLQETMDRAESTVKQGRQIAPTSDIEPNFRTREDLCTITRGFFAREGLRDQVFEAQELYRALGLMTEKDELKDILIGIQLQQVSALFDDESEAVYVLSDAANIGPREELAYALAYLSGIQQDLFDIAGLRKRALTANLDEYRAVPALITGDVVQVSSMYAATTFSREQLDVLTQPLADNKLETAPNVVRKAALFPGKHGADFVAELFGTDNAGWAGVNAAYARPPITTEQILHPEKYFSDEGPQVTIIPDISSDLGKGWVQISHNTMGEFVIRAYLEEHLDDIQAATAAEGWGGDRYSLLVGPEGERLLLSMIKWDDFQEAAEFLDIYKVYLGSKGQTTGGETNRIGDSTVSWSSAAESIFVGRSGPVILLIVGEKNETVGSALTHLEDALAAAAAAGP